MKVMGSLPELDHVLWVVVVDEPSKAQLGVEVGSEEEEVGGVEVEAEIEEERPVEDVVGKASEEDHAPY